VIQGAADTGKRLTSDELHKTMDFVQHIFSPTDPDMHTAVGARVDPSLFSPSGPVMTPAQVDSMVQGESKEAEEERAVLKEVNARKPIHIMYTGTANFELEEVAGWKVRCERGTLGLIRA
jgi:flavine halogenase